MPKPTPKAEHPAWLKRLIEHTPDGMTDEMLEEAEGGWLRQADYTQKTQEIAAVKKIMDANPGLNLEEAIKTHEWAKTQWPSWKASYDGIRTENETLKSRPAATTTPAPASTRRGKVSQEISVEDLYETDRLRSRFQAFEEELVPAAVTAMREGWYQKEEIPRLDRVAQGYLGTMLNLVKAIWPKDAPDPETVLKEAAIRGTPDLVGVYNDLIKNKTVVAEGGFNEGFKKGRDEAEADFRKKFNIPENGNAPASSGTNGPISATQPTWKKPAEATPKGAADRFAAVMQKVESKHGVLPR